VVNSLHGRITGSIAEEFVSDIFVKKAFISTVGVSLEGGVTEYDSEKALLSRRFIQNAQVKYALCDHTKLGKRSFYKICNLNELTGIVCDKRPSQRWIQYIEKYNMEWIAPSEG
jgi:Transcriptional regulators of sugar metabolism